ncbi:MAG: hypothetical protein PVI86_15800 [Phycisphaerae bacterium]|jgi:hypothetical protein
MTVKQLRKVHGARPFRPFTLRLTDGSRLTVPHPEFLYVLPGGRTAFVPNDRDPAETVDILLIDAIEMANGKPRSRRKKS